jgi:hypothetical protein
VRLIRLSFIALHYESTAPAYRPQLPREAGATAGFTIRFIITASTGRMRLTLYPVTYNAGIMSTYLYVRRLPE